MRYIISSVLASLTASTAFAEVPRVVTDLPPVQALVAQVMGDLGTPELLLDQGADPHDFQLRPSQAAALAEAGLVVWIGPEMTPWLDHALEGLSPDLPRLGLLAAPETKRREFAAEEGHEDHAEEGGEGEEAGHTEGEESAEGEDHDHDHAHSGTDPHAWLDPQNAQTWLGLIAAELGRLDPEHSAEYQARAVETAAEIAALDGEIAASLAPVKDQPFIVFHDAYGYFAAHYGLNIIGSLAEGDAHSPGAAHLAELAEKAGGGKVRCLFPEAGHDPKLAAQLAEGAGLRLGPALEPEGVTLTPGPDLYAELMHGLARGLTTCLSAP